MPNYKTRFLFSQSRCSRHTDETLIEHGVYSWTRIGGGYFQQCSKGVHMSGILRFFLYNMWEKSKGPGGMYIWFFIITLMVAYASIFPFLVEIFGTTTRIFPAIYMAIAALSWGLRGGIPVSVLNIGLNIFLYKHAGRPFEGGVLGPAGCLFAAGLVGTISDLVRQLDFQLQQRRAIEAVLEENEKRYRCIFNMASDALLLVDEETGQILEANASASKIYGYSRDEFRQLSNTDLSAQPEDTRNAILQQKKHIPLRYHKKRSGMVFPAEITVQHFIMEKKPVHVDAIRDITSRMKADEEKKRLEAQFYQAQKMESIGTLAGGIAHDFNNLLGGILGHASLGLLKIKPDDPTYEHLTVIEKLVKSGRELTRHILGFARGGKYEVKTTDLNELISRHNLIFGRTHKHITIDESLGNDLWRAEIDRGQIEQVLFNIYINSIHAMPEKGSIYISTENITISDARLFSFPVKPGDYIKIFIRDTGTGMDETTRQRIFEPFFSTKDKGVGTGLGMAAAYGIVKNHGGHIDVQSELQHGTTVVLLFPRSNKNFKACSTPPHNQFERGSGTILVIDDEEVMLGVVTQMIQVLGYDALTAKSGSEAVSIYREKKNVIDLVLLDMIMPDMDGAETFARLKEIDQDIKVLFNTGQNIVKTETKVFPEGGVGGIKKPFTLDALSKEIKAAVNSPSAIL